MADAASPARGGDRAFVAAADVFCRVHLLPLSLGPMIAA